MGNEMEARSSLLVARIDLGKIISLKLPVVGAPVALKGVEIGYVFGTPGRTQWEKMTSLVGGQGITLPGTVLPPGGFLLATVEAGGSPLAIPPVQFAQAEQNKQETYKSVALAETLPIETVGAESAEAAPNVGAGSTETAPAAIWKEVNRSLGSVHIDRVGIGYESKDKAVVVLLDAAIEAGGLRLAPKGLRAGIPFTPPHTPVFHLDGLSLGYNRPPVTLAGEFIRRPGYEKDEMMLAGMAVLGTPALSISALGFYAQKKGRSPSLFVFGKLDLSKKSIGGPIFRLKKVAAGFGYQTRVRTPAISEVQSFPFVSMLKTSSSEDPLMVLDTILGYSGTPWVYPESDNIWLAAGLNGTVYELVDITAVAIGQFGHDFTLGLYGTAEATFPKASRSPWARLMVDVRAEYRSSKDTLEIDAAVAPGSFLVSQNCRLTGSAAVRAWFGRSDHPGDFVVTVGGYHPRFNKPKHYPVSQRLGFDWHVSSGIYAKGECYAALTPHAFMAGFNSHVHGDFGPFVADLQVYADALFEWNPFYFDLSFGCSAHVRLKPFPAVEASIHGEVWGPPVGGHCVGTLWGLKKEADFGSKRRDTSKALTAEEFRKNMLPEKAEQVIHVVPTDGLRPGEKPSDDEKTVWMVGSGFQFNIGTAVPATEVTVNGTQAVWDVPKDPESKKEVPRKTKLYIRPMQSESSTAKGYDSNLSVKVLNNSKPVPVNTNGKGSWTATAVSTGVPEALWGKREDRREIAAQKDGGLVNGYAPSLQVAAPHPDLGSSLTIPASAFEENNFDCEIPRQDIPPNFPGKKSGTSRQEIHSGISSDSVRQARDAVVGKLGKMIGGLTAGELKEFAKTAEDLDGSPMLAQES